jgi:phosphoglycolate phosphatase-like HAD superfamily hydrolase
VATTCLVLWDIDHTLLTIKDVSRDLYAAAFRPVTGRDLQQMPSLAGRTDHMLITTVLAAHGIEATPPTLRAFYPALVAAAQQRRDQMKTHGRALPGAHAALDALARTPAVVQSVVTGNLRPIAELKLTLFGLHSHIDFEAGGYGSDDSDRAVLVRRALRRAASRYRASFSPTQAVVIGDTTHDIAGALANGLPAVGVASGDTSAEDLAAAGAKVVLPSLADTQAVLRAVLGQLETTSA